MRTIENKNILVTGGAGFIGSHLVDRLIAEKANKVIAMDSMFLGSESNLESATKQGAHLIKDDINLKALLSMF